MEYLKNCFSPSEHLMAMFLVFLFFSHDYDKKEMSFLKPYVDQRSLVTYTPYYPGMGDLEMHQIFDPRYDHVQKILFLGPSYVDSVGCDATWSRKWAKKLHLSPNAHWLCSIASQFQTELANNGIKEKNVKVFNLARNGSKGLPMLYTYLVTLKRPPDLVIFGDGDFNFATDNLDLDVFSFSELKFMDDTINSFQDDEIRSSWSDLKVAIKFDERLAILSQNSETEIKVNPLKNNPLTKKTLSAETLVTWWIRIFYEAIKLDFPERAPVIYKKMTPYKLVNFEVPKDLRILNLFLIIDRLQKKNHGGFIFYSGPSNSKKPTAWQQQFKESAGNWLNQRNIMWIDLISLRLNYPKETYDRRHQTLFGNKIIAHHIFGMSNEYIHMLFDIPSKRNFKH